MQGELNFRQNPTFEDCFPASEKCYKTVTDDGLVLRVRTSLGLNFGASCETNEAVLAAGAPHHMSGTDVMLSAQIYGTFIFFNAATCLE